MRAKKKRARDVKRKGRQGAVGVEAIPAAQNWCIIDMPEMQVSAQSKSMRICSSGQERREDFQKRRKKGGRRRASELLMARKKKAPSRRPQNPGAVTAACQKGNAHQPSSGRGRGKWGGRCRRGRTTSIFQSKPLSGLLEGKKEHPLARMGKRGRPTKTRVLGILIRGQSQLLCKITANV